jgi:glycosyltransferase involved in cell wall biosynthesis
MNELPQVSFIMPCYNEEGVIGYTIPRLVKAFQQAGHRLELVACDNGSSDRTGEIIERFVAEGYPVVYHRVDVNQGYGFGVLDAIRRCRAPYIGIIPADGQVDAEDVVKVYESVSRADRPVIGKVRRRFRLDGAERWVVSVIYNFTMLALWPGLGTLDVNGSPKVIPRSVLEELDLTSKDWLLDPEIMIKARHLGVPVIEMNAFSRMRESGISHVKPTTVWTFLRKLAGFKWGSQLRDWSKKHQRS